MWLYVSNYSTLKFSLVVGLSFINCILSTVLYEFTDCKEKKKYREMTGAMLVFSSIVLFSFISYFVGNASAKENVKRIFDAATKTGEKAITAATKEIKTDSGVVPKGSFIPLTTGSNYLDDNYDFFTAKSLE